MAQTKMISIRMPEELLNAISQLSDLHQYLNRSTVVCNLLTNVLKCSSRWDIERLASTYDCYGDGYSIHVTRKDKLDTNL